MRVRRGGGGRVVDKVDKENGRESKGGEGRKGKGREGKEKKR